MTLATAAGNPQRPPVATLPAQFPPLTRQTGRLSNVRPGDMLPNGFKIRGTNLIPTLQQELTAGGGTGGIWSYIWTQWDIAWLRSCLDDAVKLGCNTVRLLSTVGGIYYGEITRSQVLAQWSQLSQECQKRGLFLYPSGVDSTLGDRFGNLPYSFVEQEIVAWAAHMHTLPDVIGLDLVTESGPSFALTANALSLYNAVKAVTNHRTTYSTSQQPNPASNCAPGFNADRQDYLDFHTYYYVPTPTIFDAYWAAGGTRPIMVGEFGLPESNGTTNIGAYYLANQRLAERVTPTGQRASAGTLQWAIRDYDNDPGNQYGAFDLNNVEKPTQGSIIRSLPRI